MPNDETKVTIYVDHSLGLHLISHPDTSTVEIEAIQQKTSVTLNIDAKSLLEGLEELSTANAPVTLRDDESYIVIRVESPAAYRIIVNTKEEHMEFVHSQEDVRTKLHEAGKGFNVALHNKGVYGVR